MLIEFNVGHSKSYYCIAATVFDFDELMAALTQATKDSKGIDLKNKSKILHSILENIAGKKDYCLKLRK